MQSSSAVEGVALTSRSDLVGRVQIPVAQLMKEPNKMIRREDKLMGFEDANDMPGKGGSVFEKALS
jgi:hypothetical protein